MLKLSKLGGIFAGFYLLIAMLVILRLLLDGYIGHGNGLEFLLGIVVTLPLSFLLVLVDDFLTEANTFYMTGWPYYRTLCELAAGAIFNAAMIHTLVRMIQRKSGPGRAG
jgi:hypothetical protein